MATFRTRYMAMLPLAALALMLAVLLIRPDRPAEAAAQENAPKNSGADEQAIRKAGAAYLDALNKGDLNALMAVWTADADYIDESGKPTRGRDAITALVKKTLPDLKGTKVTSKLNSLKFLRPEVALEDGSLTFSWADGSKTSNRYALVWVKSGERWLISSARDLPAEADDLPSLPYASLRGLEWLVGEWQDASDKIDVNIVCRWDRNRRDCPRLRQ
jgi:uncharacterized protein (TIGR02246 family)